MSYLLEDIDQNSPPYICHECDSGHYYKLCLDRACANNLDTKRIREYNFAEENKKVEVERQILDQHSDEFLNAKENHRGKSVKRDLKYEEKIWQVYSEYRDEWCRDEDEYRHNRNMTIAKYLDDEEHKKELMTRNKDMKMMPTINPYAFEMQHNFKKILYNTI